MDLVDIATQLADKYTFGMITAPLVLSGLAIKAFDVTKPENSPELRPIAWGVAAVALFAGLVLVPPYFATRSQCEELLQSAQFSFNKPAALGSDQLSCKILLHKPL